MLKPEHLDPIRSVLRSLPNRLTRRSREPEAGEPARAPTASTPEPKRTWWATWRRVYHRLGTIIFWLFVIYIGVALVHNVFTGGAWYGSRFGFGNLYIMYDVNHGGLLHDRLVDAIILQSIYPEQTIDTYTFVFPGNHSLTVRPKRGETVWIDDQYQVTHLGRTLRPRDFATLQQLSHRERSVTISSPQEFLTLVAKLRSEPNAPREPWAVADK